MVFYCCLCNWGTQSTILTNHPKSFQHSDTYETGLSDFHKLTYTVLLTYSHLTYTQHTLKTVTQNY